MLLKLAKRAGYVVRRLNSFGFSTWTWTKPGGAGGTFPNRHDAEQAMLRHLKRKLEELEHLGRLALEVTQEAEDRRAYEISQDLGD